MRPQDLKNRILLNLKGRLPAGQKAFLSHAEEAIVEELGRVLESHTSKLYEIQYRGRDE